MRAAQVVRAADLVVIFGTDHYSEPGQLLTLTRQNYATPFGVLPTSREVVDAIAQVSGLETAFDGELRHRSEHSVELAAVWLHYIRNGEPCELVPVLCGSLYSPNRDHEEPANDTRIIGVLDAITNTTVGRRVVVVAAGDLAHVGPAFEGQPLDFAHRVRLKADDEALIERMCSGDEEGVFQLIRQVENKNNVCGLAPIYWTMRALGETRGENVAYDLCPADENGTSVVSVCGVVFW
jgi:AmmeMemoRadiSam system protein B